jgi:ADP-ribose pyrophosphatase YjhB (NUDIX family)
MAYTYEYPRPALTVDCVIFGLDEDAELKVMLVERGGEPFKGRWALPGGFVRIEESLDDAARRELAEELGVTGVQLVPVFRAWYHDDRTHYLAFGYEAVWDGPVVHQPEEVAEGGWVEWEELLRRLEDPAWPFVPDGRAGMAHYLGTRPA